MSTDTPQTRADRITASLNEDPDAVRRYHTIRLLQDGGQLRHTAATALRQLRAELGTTEAAAAAVGISRQAANELLSKAGAPGAREDRGQVATSPAAGYGRWLATVDTIAFLAAQTKQGARKGEDPEDRWLGRMEDLMAGTARFAAAQPDVQRWLSWLAHDIQDQWRDRINDALALVTQEWLQENSYMSPTSDAAAEVVIVYHKERKLLRDSESPGARERLR